MDQNTPTCWLCNAHAALGPHIPASFGFAGRTPILCPHSNEMWHKDCARDCDVLQSWACHWDKQAQKKSRLLDAIPQSVQEELKSELAEIIDKKRECEQKIKECKTKAVLLRETIHPPHIIKLEVRLKKLQNKVLPALGESIGCMQLHAKEFPKKTKKKVRQMRKEMETIELELIEECRAIEGQIKEHQKQHSASGGSNTCFPKRNASIWKPPP